MTRLSIDDNIDRALEGFTWTHVSDWSPHSVTIQAASQAPGAENICVHMRPCMLVWNGANVCPLACTTRHQNESCLHTTLYTSTGTSYESAAAPYAISAYPGEHTTLCWSGVEERVACR